MRRRLPPPEYLLAAGLAGIFLAAVLWPFGTVVPDTSTSREAREDASERTRSSSPSGMGEASEADRLIWEGLGHLEAGRAADAAAAFERASELAPDSFPAWLDLGIARLRLSEAEAAERAFRRALEIEPGNPDAAHNLGYALRIQGRAVEAVEVFDRVLARDPDRAITLYESALACFDAGLREEAAARLGRLVQVDPGHTAGRARLERLMEEMRGEGGAPAE